VAYFDFLFYSEIFCLVYVACNDVLMHFVRMYVYRIIVVLFYCTTLPHYSTTQLYYTPLLHYSTTLLYYTNLLHYSTTLLYYTNLLH